MILNGKTETIQDCRSNIITKIIMLFSTIGKKYYVHPQFYYLINI